MLEALTGVQTPDETLVGRSRGRFSAREELFQRHRTESYRYAYRLLGHEQDALDVVQEAMLKAFSALGDFDGRSGFRTWLLRIVTNTAYDWGRRRKRTARRRGGGVEDRASQEPVSDDDPARRLNQQDLRQTPRSGTQPPELDAPRDIHSIRRAGPELQRNLPRPKMSRSAP